jgi:cytochrome P450
VLHDHAHNYTKLDTPDLMLLTPMLGEGLLTTVGPVWKQDRQWLQPAFARRQLESSATVMVDVAEGMLARWRARSEPEATVDVVRELSRLTLEIAARVLYSTDITAGSEAFGEAMDVLNESMSHPNPGSDEVQRRFRPALELIRRRVWQIILARKFADTGQRDVLASLLGAQRERGDSDQHLLDQAVTLLLAGHETTAKALSWSVALLDAHEDARTRLLEELDGALAGRHPNRDDLARLPFTRAVVEETLRLDPPIWLLTRTAIKADEVAGYPIPAGALVAISPYLVHRHPDLWEQPDSFHPQRFLSTDGASHAYRYLPFGHGPRHCVGKYFAMLEMPLVLATLYSKVIPARLPGHGLEPEALVTLRPRHGLPMRPVRRR